MKKRCNLRELLINKFYYMKHLKQKQFLYKYCIVRNWLYGVCLILCSVFYAQAQTQGVSGTVVDVNGEPVIGASVVVKGSTYGVVTGGDGRYNINAQQGSTLAISSIGYTPQEVLVNNNVIDVVLQEDALHIDDVVVTALGITRSKKAVGYATQDVSTDDLTRTGNSNVISSLQGKVSGIDIKPSSGMPGASSQMVIRGARSFTGNNTPLYVIDGMPISSESNYSTGNSVTGADVANRAIDIDPADIESINILKGQAAAALYGIRASNGVIIITTKSGKHAKGRPVVTFSNSTSFESLTRKPDIQQIYAQGYSGTFIPNSSMAWGPKISDLPNDRTYGGNTNNKYTEKLGLQQGKYFVPQREQAGLDPWQAPKAYDNLGDFLQLGYTVNTNVNIAQASDKFNYSFGVGNSTQQGIVPSTDMRRYTAKFVGEVKLSKWWKTGLSANYAQTAINKIPGANDGLLATIWAAVPSYDLKGIPSSLPSDPYSQIHFRSLTFNNPYWGAKHNKFYEKTNRFFGNAFVEFAPQLNLGKNEYLRVRYQGGVDAFTTNYEDLFEYGTKGGSGELSLYGNTSSTFNSLATVSFGIDIVQDLKFGIMVGNETIYDENKRHAIKGTNFNYGGFPHISNTLIQSSVIDAYRQNEYLRSLSSGYFGNIDLSWKDMIFLNATGRYDIVSIMPRGNRSFFYPSVSLGFVITELEPLKGNSVLSFAKIRGSFAQVGQTDRYYDNFYYQPDYSGSWWSGNPIIYPVGGVSSFIPYYVIYDPNLKPQNTQSWEVGLDVRFFKGLFGIDYTFSRQDVVNQIFDVPLAGSSGVQYLKTNGGSIYSNVHELVLSVNPIRTKDVDWTLGANFSKIDNYVKSLAEGVESIFLGGFVTPQVRAGIGDKFPVIYGGQFKKDDQGRILVDEDPTSPYYGMPMQGGSGVLGSASPDFTLGFNTTVRYKWLTLAATFDWKQGGVMYSGTNGLYYVYGLSKETEDRTKPFIVNGYKSDGTPNNIVRGGAGDEVAYQYYYGDILGNIDEAYIFESSFLKLREISLSAKVLERKNIELTLSVYARNLLLWTTLPNIDPESSQGNNNMGGAFERFSPPQTSSYGFGVNLTF